MNLIVVSWDIDVRWTVETIRNGECEAATGDVLECQWLPYRRALSLARELGRKMGLRVAVYPRRGGMFWIPVDASSPVKGGAA